MSTIQISASPAEYRDGFVTVKIGQMASANIYREVIETSKLADIYAAVQRARATLDDGTNGYMIYTRVLVGRKPNGYDAWRDLNRALFEVRPAAL